VNSEITAPRRRGRKFVIIGVAALLLLLALAAAGLDHWLPHMLLSHYKFAVDPAPSILEEYKATAEGISFKTGDGLNIRGWFIPAPQGTPGKPVTLIVLHTLGRTREDMLEFSLPLWKQGFNLALIDMRGHGQSDAKFFTYGYHEWQDVTGLIDWLERRKDGSADHVALLGASAGGAVAISAAARDRRIKALVAIASFADLGEMIERGTSWLPGFWRKRAIARAEHLGGFKVSGTSPLKNIALVKCPVLIAHGDADNHVPYDHAKRLLAAATAPKELHPIPGANHATMFAQGGEELRNKIADFARRALGPVGVLAAAEPEPPSPSSTASLEIRLPKTATVFGLCEIRVVPRGKFKKLASLPDTQVHDAYDADRDGRYVRLRAEFKHEKGGVVTIPGFAMREKFDGDWQWRVRFSPRRAGKWTCRILVDVSLSKKPGALFAERSAATGFVVKLEPKINGPLVAPKAGQHPGYLRRLKPDGKSEALWLFGACRAWVVDLQDKHNDWHPHEWLDREKELLAPMRAAGYNLLNQWMAPWEFLIVHHDRAEFWREDNKWKRHALPKEKKWSAYQCIDQGRARAFDDLLRLCEGDANKPTVHLLLSPMPHQCLQLAEHPWGAQESGWSPANDKGKQTPERLNGFSAFRKDMKVWEFFQADPSKPLKDWRSQLFDHQANYFRYLVARWGYSRAVGVWVLVDELDAVGNEVGVMSTKKGWWAHPECDRWLANVIRLFRGKLKRSDGASYVGDPYRHPLHAATTSYGGGASRGGNLDWKGGPPDARPDLFGWHWYPWFKLGADWPQYWTQMIDGVTSYNRAAIGKAPRLISEFGAPDRSKPKDPPSRFYPTMYHHAIWAAIFSGQAGTPMDWDDGKQFGELVPRARKGIFSRKQYPINNAAEVKALRAFLGKLEPDALRSCAGKDAKVRCVPGSRELRVLALHAAKGSSAVHGWGFSPDGKARFSLGGLPPGKYQLTWFDPWTGRPVPGLEIENLEIKKNTPLALDAGPVLKAMRTAAAKFPTKSRKDRGWDFAFKLVATDQGK
jgi:uncharacterized protein